MARCDYGIAPVNNSLVFDIKAQGGSSPSNDGFFEGMMFGVIAGSAF